jgi:pimeloyl-ACP methyl ester carboxylesterase
MLADDSHDAGLAARVREIMAAARPAGVINALLGMAERPDATPLLRRIAVPTLIVAGARDALIPVEESGKLAQAIPGAQLKIIAHAGHLVALEQPQQFNDALAHWLEHRCLASPAESVRSTIAS